MPAQLPEVTRTGDRRPGIRDNVVIMLVRFGFRCRIQDDVDVRHFKAGEHHLEAVVEQPLQFDGKDFLVPAGFLGQPVVGQNIGPLLDRAKVAELQCRHLLDIQQLGCRDPGRGRR